MSTDDDEPQTPPEKKPPTKPAPPEPQEPEPDEEKTNGPGSINTRTTRT